MLISINDKHLFHSTHCFATVFYGLPIDQRRNVRDLIPILGVRNGKRLKYCFDNAEIVKDLILSKSAEGSRTESN